MNQTEENAFTRIMKPTRGARVGVLKQHGSRGFAVGTVCVVQAVSKHEDRILLEGVTEGSEHTAWVDITSVVRLDRDKPDALSWVEYEEFLAHEEAPYKKGSRVILHDGRTGVVFWTQNTRLGITPSNRRGLDGKFADAIFCNTSDVLQLDFTPP